MRTWTAHSGESPLRATCSPSNEGRRQSHSRSPLAGVKVVRRWIAPPLALTQLLTAGDGDRGAQPTAEVTAATSSGLCPEAWVR